MQFETNSSRLASTLGAMLRPAVGFERPDDVLKDPDLSAEDKRAILSSWASDACAVPDRPGWRRLPGSETVVPILEILDARRRLDGDKASPVALPNGWRSALGVRARRPEKRSDDLTLEEFLASWSDQQEVLSKILQSAEAIPDPPPAVRRIAEAARSFLDEGRTHRRTPRKSCSGGSLAGARQSGPVHRR